MMLHVSACPLHKFFECDCESETSFLNRTKGKGHQMRKMFIALFTGLVVLSMAASGAALDLELYVDSAPNAYSPPVWDPYWSQTKADVVAGTFTNLDGGTYPGTLTIDPYDEIVYSTGDLGKRLHWIYYVPGETTAGLDGLFEVKMIVDWGGVDYTYDWDNGGAFAVDGSSPDIGWVQPGSWEDSPSGVIGTFGHAWWATDDDADPLSTDSNPYNEVDQADIDALREAVLAAQTHATGLVRYRESIDDDWQYTTLKVSIPDASTLILLGSASLIGGLVSWRRRSKA